MEFKETARILDADDMQRAIVRVAHEIVERNHGTKDLVLVGIQRRGVTVARRVAEAIAHNEGVEVPFGTLDITFYRDDLSTLGPAPSVGADRPPFDINGKTIVLVDDVLYTGRTVRAAMNELMDFGQGARDPARRARRPRPPRAADPRRLRGQERPHLLARGRQGAWWRRSTAAEQVIVGELLQTEEG